MGNKVLFSLLWLLTAFTLTTQELVKLTVTPKITAKCNKHVILNCDVSSSRNEQLIIKRLEWFRNHTSLCSVDSRGNMTHPKHTHSHFRCVYEDGKLSLIFRRVQPLDIGKYRCKLQSNQAALHNYTTVELQECNEIVVDGVMTCDRPACTFRNVYPDGDVHWFHGSHNLSDGSVRINTTKQMDKGGWMTIHSYLERKGSGGPYNCSLWSTESGRYIASTLVENKECLISFRQQEHTNPGNGVGSQRPVWTFVFISILLAVTLE